MMLPIREVTRATIRMNSNETTRSTISSTPDLLPRLASAGWMRLYPPLLLLTEEGVIVCPVRDQSCRVKSSAILASVRASWGHVCHLDEPEASIIVYIDVDIDILASPQ